MLDLGLTQLTDAALMGRMLNYPKRVVDGRCRRVPSMEIQITPVPSSAGSLGIALRGRISYREAPELRQTVLDTLARKDVASVIVDLAQVERTLRALYIHYDLFP